MIRKCICAAVWLLMAGTLYFFENNTGTRIVLAAAIILPFALKLFPARERGVEPVERDLPARDDTGRSDDAIPGDIRDYVPGDPVRRIHWKLSAKMDRLLVRQDEPDVDAAPMDEPKPSPAREAGEPKIGDRLKAWRLFIPAAVMAAALAMLLLIPDARNGAMALINRLYDWSESVNAYVYDRFAVPEGQSVMPAAGLLLLCLAAWLTLTVLQKRHWPVLMTAAALAGFQAYFGVALPPWLNVMSFSALGLLELRPLNGKKAAVFIAAVLAAALLVGLTLPGVDSATEAASERVRDRLSRLTQGLSGTAAEAPADAVETRHVNPQSLLTGEQEARSGKTYRLVTREEEQISMPRWVDYLRIALLLLLSAALIVLPFMPFYILNARRKKARVKRQAFESSDAGEAVVAMFYHVVTWLNVTGHGAGNRLFAAWSEALTPDLPVEYAGRFLKCETLFEEARYSDHPMSEADRAELLALVDETENMLYVQSDWKTRFRLKYVECVCE